MAAVLLDPKSLTSHHAVLALREQVFQAGLRDGRFTPLVFPLVALGTAPLLVYVLSPKLNGRLVRLATFAATGAFHGWVILKVRTSSPTGGFALGVLSGWNILWSAVLLVFRDAKKEFQRVKRVEVKPATAAVTSDGASTEKKALGADDKSSDANSTKPSYVWQPYPANGTIKERLGWYLDLIYNFRGVGWNWRISGIPSRPPRVEASLNGIDEAELLATDRPVSSAGRKRSESVREVLKHNAWLILAGFAGLDFLKTIINRDPYFWGLTDQPPPSYLPALVRASPLLTHVYRTTVTMTYLWLNLRTVFAVFPLIYMGLLGTKGVGSSGEAWVWPDQFGSYKTVFDRGLAGFWGGWWHQVFRFGFQSGGKFLAKDVLGLKDGSPLSTVVQLCTSFNLSGLLHAAASTTMLGNTRPFRGSAMFFVLQPIGIISGVVWSHYWTKSGLGASLPSWIGQTVNFAYSNAWIYLTAPLLGDDLVRGGLLLGEPLPFSPLRGLGFGVPGDGFFCWAGNSLAVADKGPWWLRGITI